jgi:DNA-binding NarL/FixJ family response regulator
MTDLKNMPVYEFAEHYKIPMTTAIRWRAILLERLRNPRKRSTRAIVLGVIQSSLTNREAAEAIALTADRVAQMRRNLQRRGTAYSEAAKGVPNKWNTPTALAVLRSGRPDSQIAHALGISTSHAHRLRKTLASL